MNHYDKPEFFAAYAQMYRSIHGLAGAGEWAPLQRLFPDLAGNDVLDLGCGYGWHCRYAAEKGARRVVGIDLSERMIAEARSRGADENVEYRVCGIEEYEYPAEQFDLILSNLALHYVEDLRGVYRSAYGALRPGGTFLMNIEHPVFTAGVGQRFSADGTWPVDGYFYPGERQTDFLGHAIAKQHHTLTQILQGLLDEGFLLEAVEEVLPPEEWREQMPEEMRRPMMLLVRAAKTKNRLV